MTRIGISAAQVLAHSPTLFQNELQLTNKGQALHRRK
nr:MAG TPA: hypothetical protein [Caudoviricetes sp.]